jgi:zona occludens toxin (predicted ATPase)
MQTNIFDDLSLLLPYLADLEIKIQTLQKIRKVAAMDTADITINIDDEKELEYYTFTQKNTSLILRDILLKIIDDSIDEYQRIYSNISQYKHQLDK